MRTRDLARALPPHTVDGPVRRGQPVPDVLPGDFLLSRAHGAKHAAIQWGQALRLPTGMKHYAGYTHAALIVSAAGRLVEATGRGVNASSLARYRRDHEVFQVVRIETSPQDRAQIVAFGEHARRTRGRYSWQAAASVTAWAFFGSPLLLTVDGGYTCSGLVAEALERMGVIFEVNAAKVTPAQLAITFDAPPPPRSWLTPRRAARRGRAAPGPAERARRAGRRR